MKGVNKLSKTELAYAAGIIDGEGCILLNNQETIYQPNFKFKGNKKGLSLRERIKALLLSEGMTEAKEIAENLDENELKIRARLNDHKNVFKHFKEGWGVIDGEQPSIL